jgi:hypothetical protein
MSIRNNRFDMKLWNHPAAMAKISKPPFHPMTCFSMVNRQNLNTCPVAQVRPTGLQPIQAAFKLLGTLLLVLMLQEVVLPFFLHLMQLEQQELVFLMQFFF